MHAHLEEYGERSSKDTLLRLATEALAQDPENHIKMSTMLNRQARVFEVREPAGSCLPQLISQPGLSLTPFAPVPGSCWRGRTTSWATSSTTRAWTAW